MKTNWMNKLFMTVVVLVVVATIVVTLGSHVVIRTVTYDRVSYSEDFYGIGWVDAYRTVTETSLFGGTIMTENNLQVSWHENFVEFLTNTNRNSVRIIFR